MVETARDKNLVLSDDGIDSIIVKLTSYLEDNCVGSLFDEDEYYDPWVAYIRELLEPYSNGYRNCN
jgi:hypothetical protein